EINELNAKTTYENKQLTFDASARQTERSVSTAGSLLLHPDHQEIHLQQLNLTTQNMQWQRPPNTSPALQYGGDALDVKGLRLVSGQQEISADGGFGTREGALTIKL